MLVPGDDFGEVAVLHRVPRQATVTATEACTLLSMPGEHVRMAARERGGALRKLVES